MTIISYIKIALFCLLLILSQVYIFDLIHIANFGKIMVYPLMLFLIPIHVPRIIVLFAGFFLGLALDFLLGTGGLNTAALTFMAFCRGGVLDIMEPNSGYDKNESTSVLNMQLFWYILFAFVMVFIHQFVYYFLERFSFYNFVYTFGRILSGTVLSTFSIVLISLLFSPIDSKRRVGA